MDADQLIQSLGLTLGLPNLRFDAHGCARLAIEGAPALNLERDASGGLHLYSVLCPIPPDGREAVYSQLLQGNLFGTATAGASLAVDELHGEIVLCDNVKAEQASAQTFATQVEAFVAAAEDWQGRLSTAPSQARSPASQAAPRMMDHFIRG
ncbi:type III secretion system chaperone [Caenimonas sp. SL110]|uniref:type III secretion system chaperone n=1 Tax=Caenimonas sp. SL110 TaxID=1450524 RepID=UPI0006548F24|nr:type III secretion system chaperone [Caenimonas sp. SL110]